MPDRSALFPLTSVGDVRRFVSAELALTEPNLALLSIVVGALEHQWTENKVPPEICVDSSSSSSVDASVLSSSSVSCPPCEVKVRPQIEWHQVESLYAKFESIIRGYCDTEKLRSALEDAGQIRPLVKHVADIVWNTLSKSHYKDKPHLQTIYSYLTGTKLDCFGVAYAVVAACQLLGVSGVNLALSEDHAWVVFGPDGTETAEVTWHGKGNEDKRGQPVEIEKAKNSWLYVAGQPVVCDRYMEVASLVSSINPALTANLDSVECGVMQQELLWLLYDLGHLKNYPMALGNLADLEEISPSLGRPPCWQLFYEAIQVNMSVYKNHHVYPYTYEAGYYYRKKQFKKALESWAMAADVIKRYRYSKDDEEIYKEFMEIANDLIPHTVKAASLDPKTYREVLKQPECFASILRFYDGICCWEEGSPTPVLHIGWARPMVATCSKFEAEVRVKVELAKEETDDVESDDSSEGILQLEEDSMGLVNNNYYKDNKDLVPKDSSNHSDLSADRIRANSSSSPPSPYKCDMSTSSTLKFDSNQMVLVRKIFSKTSREVSKESLLRTLSEGCKENVLNVEFLLGRETTPFVCKTKAKKSSSRTVSGSRSNQSKKAKLSTTDEMKTVFLRLHSAKMKGLKDLLCADKLNASAIQLQLTAQSQTQTPANPEEDGKSRPRRSRRE